jgi:hypothetical protein
MSEVFLWRSSGKYAEYSGKTEEDDRKIAWNVLGVGDPLPPLSEWKTPLLTQYLGEKGKRRPRKIGDSPTAGSPTLISQKAADALRDIWDRHAILYPVRLDDAPGEMYYMVVVKTVLDCLDESASRVAKDHKGRIRVIYEWVFKDGCLDDSDLFHLPYNKISYYASERFKARVIEAGLKGFAFRTHFWDSKPFTS